MKTIQVQNGDIALDSGGRLQFVQGTSKLVQDLTLWLKENYGIGFTSPNFGSLLPGLIGAPMTGGTLARVRTEVTRIISLYQSQQILALKQSQTRAQLSNWNKSEIINSIDSIVVTPNYTSINITVGLTTLSGSTLSLTILITSEGLQVS